MQTIIRAGALALAAVLAGCTSTETETETEVDRDDDAAAATPALLAFTVNRIDGTPQPLDVYEGQVVLIVNTASRCGLTPQYAKLESLYESRADEGFVVLGFPANDFGNQEPGSNMQIAAFCEANYGVSFPMFEKVSVKGSGQHPLFAALSSESSEPNWNFTKYLLDREGRLVERFGPRTSPDDPALVAKVDRLLEAG
ncbi:MAG: glutathione peroxidase [Planctomycetota bacterium]